MSEENTAEEFEFEEIIEEGKTRLEYVEHLEVIPIIPQKLVIYPYENMKTPVGDAVLKRLCDEIKKADGLIGMVEADAEDGGLPPVGTIGVGADVISVDRKLLGKENYHVHLQGYIRFTIDEYVETDEPYALARVTFFEDDPPTEKEKKLLPQFCQEFRHLLRELNKLAGIFKILKITSDEFKDEYAELFSFACWFCFKPIPPEIRKMIIEERSTLTRLYLLNRQIERTIKRVKKSRPARWN